MTAMVNPWRKFLSASKRKKQTLHSLTVGFVLFLVLYMITKLVSIPLCLVKNLFGVNCPGCGLTRGFVAILQLDFRMAFRYNVLSVPLFFGILLYAFFCMIDILFNCNWIDKIELQCRKPYMIIFFFIVFLLSTYLNYTRYF